MKNNKSLNYIWHRGTLHTYDYDGRLIFHKRIYCRYVIGTDETNMVKELLTGDEFPTAIGVLFKDYSNIENFVTLSVGNVSPKEINKYLKGTLSNEEIFYKQVEEISSPKSVVMKREKKLKM